MNSSAELERETPFFQIVGPLFLVFALAFAGKMIPVFNIDLLLVAAVGLFMSTKWKIRGCAYAFVLLASSAVAKHLWIHENHLLQMALEGSVGFSLLISALVSQQGSALFAAVKQQIDNRSETIRYLEEDIEKQREASALEKASFTEKLADLQQNLEEVQADSSALQILNEVLRKSTAHALEEKTGLASQLLQSKYQLGQLLEEINLLQKELTRVANESELAGQNRLLFQELNAARFKEASVRLANEALLREKESTRQAQAEKEESLLRDIEDARHAMQKAQAEKEEVLAKMEMFREESLAMRSSVQGLQSVHAEALEALEAEYQEKVRTLAVRSEQTLNVEYLYRQLKDQFHEKNQLLHQTRVELFHVETELQTMKMQAEQKNLEADPLEGLVRKELEVIEGEKRALSEENAFLQDLVTHLMDAPKFQLPTVKKKVKMSSPVEQASLF